MFALFSFLSPLSPISHSFPLPFSMVKRAHPEGSTFSADIISLFLTSIYYNHFIIPVELLFIDTQVWWGGLPSKLCCHPLGTTTTLLSNRTTRNSAIFSKQAAIKLPVHPLHHIFCGWHVAMFFWVNIPPLLCGVPSHSANSHATVVAANRRNYRTRIRKRVYDGKWQVAFIVVIIIIQTK